MKKPTGRSWASHTVKMYPADTEGVPAERVRDFVPSKDPVNHPKHYCDSPSGVECIEVVEHLTFCVGNAIKYLWRAGLKEDAGTITDLEKSIWYIQREIFRLRSK